VESKNIIITGGAGFIGYHLSKQLIKKGYKVNIIDNLSRGQHDKEFKALLKSNNIKFYKKNLREKLKLNIKNPKYIFHLAGSVGVQNINKDPYNSFVNNIITLKNILDFNNKQTKKAKIILFSTSEVYSPLIKNHKVKFPLKEENNIILENKVIDRDAYYISKAINEKLVQFSKTKYLILRPHNIYGPRMGYSHVVPELIKKIFREKNKKTFKTIIFSPNHKRAFCYIDDAINQIIKLSFNKKTDNSIYNIGNMKKETKIMDLARILKKEIFKKAKLINGEITPGSPSRRVPDMKKTQRILKNSQYTSLENGLRKTIEWYLKDLKN
tara:strand:+ start:1044 stop:2021 length:978 start_codon:yes stop_codon:yes gene_type:complete